MKTKLFTLFLALVACAGTMFAWDYERVQIGDLYYNLDATNRTAEVTSQNSSYPFWSTTITTANIPSSVEYNSVTYTVTSIGGSAFGYCTGLTSVTIPNSVTSIGVDAFSNCRGLTSVMIGNSVTSIGDYAFLGCTGLTSVTIPHSVTSIGVYAFSKCTGLTSVTIPNSVTSIGSSAFYSCRGLTSVTIPNSVTSIENYTFYSCYGLTSVTIGNSVTSIGSEAFYYCTGLTSLTCEATTPPTLNSNVFSYVDKSIPLYVPAESIDLYKAADQWKDFTNILPIETPGTCIIASGSCGDNLTWSLDTKDSTLTITGSGKMTNWHGDPYAPWYEYKSYIKNVSLPDGLTSIGEGAFYGCSGLTSVTIPNSVTSIGYGAFEGCSSLTSVTIPNSVTSIGNYAFSGCSGLTSIEIPNSVTNIGWYAFSGCTGLTSIDIPNSVTSIGKSAFYNCSSLTSVTIPNSVTSIGERAFHGCSGLTSVTIPNSVTSIEDQAFVGCTSLTSVTIPNSVTSIGNYAFSGCSGLTSIEIPNSVTNIGWYALPSSLQRLTVYATTPPSANNAGVDRNTCKLYVPAESVEAYANTIWWEDFASIRAIGSGSIVKFLDWNGTVLSSQEVDSGEDAIAPANPTREGYTFIGWDKEFTNITEDLVVTAQYQINQYRVEFRDWNGTLLKADNVDWSTSAIAPIDPTRDWYTFTGWDKDFSVVTSDLVITAQYKEGQTRDNTIFFINGTNDIDISHQAIEIDFPTPPTIAGFTFLKWQVLAGDIDDGIQIQAVYKADAPTSAPEVVTNPSNPAQKLIRNGNVYILTEDSRTYTLTGQQVR